jgi:MerR family mercuric resistance operon transcriptional regulator
MTLEALTMKPLTIGQVARKAGIGVETVRLYEREGLLQEPARRQSGYRQYREDVVARLQFIRRAKELGFSLKEIKELLALRVDPSITCREIKVQAEAKIAHIEGKIASLVKMKEALLKLATVCRGRGPTSECPMLDALDNEEED